jgi:hypothetical protein
MLLIDARKSKAKEGEKETIWSFALLELFFKENTSSWLTLGKLETAVHGGICILS